MKKTIFSGAKPTKTPTLGNYIGAFRNWVAMQEEGFGIFSVVDLHSITVRTDPKELHEQTYEMLASYLAAGIDPKKSLVFLQSHVPEHTELSWVLNCSSYMGELSRMTQYKEKSQKEGVNIPAGIFTYPVLMASDILLYDTHWVPVGEDQKQHVELTRDLAGRINERYKTELFVMPEPKIQKSGARIMSLQDPNSKMSGTDPNSNGVIFLTDSDDVIMKKLKRAVTDSETEIRFDEEKKPGVSNLLTIQSVLTGKSIRDLESEYSGKQYGHLKVETGEILVEKLGPIRNEMERLKNDRAHLDEISALGAQKAREIASKKIKQVYETFGFVPRRNFS